VTIYSLITFHPDGTGIADMEFLSEAPPFALLPNQRVHTGNVDGGDSVDITDELRERNGSLDYVDVVLLGQPPFDPSSGRYSDPGGTFEACQDPNGRSFNAGDWVHRGGGRWALRIPLA